MDLRDIEEKEEVDLRGEEGKGEAEGEQAEGMREIRWSRPGTKKERDEEELPISMIL